MRVVKNTGFIKFFSRTKNLSSKYFLPKECLFSSFRGSISLEAIFVVPIFWFFIFSILMTLEMIRLQTNVFEALHQGESLSFASPDAEGEEAAREYFTGIKLAGLCLEGEEEGLVISDESTIEEDGIINFEVSYTMKPLIWWLPLGNLKVKDSVYGHAFTGYERGSDIYAVCRDELEYVYVTESGDKYHRDPNCRYIKVSPMEIDFSLVKKCRNNSGGKYYPCEVCQPSGEEKVIITPEGDRYHSKEDCPALKRTVSEITVREALANGYTPCSGCS